MCQLVESGALHSTFAGLQRACLLSDVQDAVVLLSVYRYVQVAPRRTEARTPRACRTPLAVRASGDTAVEEQPLIVRAAKGEKVERPPAWCMRQAGRCMAVYREMCIRSADAVVLHNLA